MVKWLWIPLAVYMMIFPEQATLLFVATLCCYIMFFLLMALDKLTKIEEDIKKLKEKKEDDEE